MPQRPRFSRRVGSPVAGIALRDPSVGAGELFGSGREFMRYDNEAAVALEAMKTYTADAPQRVRPPYQYSLTRKRELAVSARHYFAGAAAAPALPGTSFGGIPITFTPAPRATSIAKMTWEYFTPGEPFTKMIFSGRGS